MWNGNGQRYSDGSDDRGEVRDPSQLNAVAALASFSNVAGYNSNPLSAAARYPPEYAAVAASTMARQYSDSLYHHNEQQSYYHDGGYPSSSYRETDPYPQRAYDGASSDYGRAMNGHEGYAYGHERPLSSHSGSSSHEHAVRSQESYARYPDEEQGESSNGGHYGDQMIDPPPVAAGKVLRSPESASVSSGEDEDDASPESNYVAEPPSPRGKPEAMAKALAASIAEEERQQRAAKHESSSSPTKSSKKSSPKKTASRKKTKVSSTNSSKKNSSLFPPPSERREFLVGEKVPAITPEEYENLKELMTQFCRVPLLAEFSRPVSLLHPEVSAQYSKIISHAVDLGHICRGIRRRQYKSLRDVRLDVWLVFSNCVKYNSHPSNKEAVPSFVSIALHLREYFNNLWQEYMLPSDQLPPPEEPDGHHHNKDSVAREVLRASFKKRDDDRKRRLENSGVLVMSKSFTQKAALLLKQFVESGGCVDALDKEALFRTGKGENGGDVEVIVGRLRMYQGQLQELADLGTVDYTLEAFYTDLKKCYTEEVLEDDSALKNRFSSRIGRFFWKLAAPLHEANSRGVTQSSIWGNIAATIWARESQKKPYWPALCLGILPPAEQRECWHQAVTERNEDRLPQKLRDQLLVAKKRCEQAQKRQSLSYFLVEFLGTHEFIWVRETDIVENFDPENDPNKDVKTASKKSRSSRSSAANVVGSRMYKTAIDECLWANDEYENVLQDAFEIGDDGVQKDEADLEENYSYQVLSQSDDEADSEDKHGYDFNEADMNLSDVDEANYLVSHDGLLDTSAEGRKNAKKRTQAMKKQASPSKTVDTPSKKKRAKEQTETQSDRKKNKEQRDLERRRKKRLRERERARKSDEKKRTIKRRRSGPEAIVEEGERGLNRDKRARATAIVKAYLTRMAKDDDSKSLALGGVLTLPAANVESTGLLGMALAFRAACGELKLPDDGKEQIEKFRPWEAIDSSAPKTSAERVMNMTKQVELLEKEIERVKNEAQRRRQLALEYVTKRHLFEEEVKADEEAARQNHYKKRKKPAASKAENGAEVSPSRSDDHGAKERPAEETEAQDTFVAVEVVADENVEISETAEGDEEEPVVEAMVVDSE